MKRQVLFCLSLVVLFVGTQAHLHSKHHNPDLPQKLELLQTKAATEAEATATTATGTETDCEPECLYKFPYLDGECDEPEEPETPPKNRTFILEDEGCYYFNLTVEEPPKNETFVEEYEGCYNFTGKPHESDESCEDTSVIYRYPFIHPGEDCPVSEETNFYSTSGNYEEPLISEEWVTVNEDGETTIYNTYEGGDTTIYPNGTTVVTINEDSENFVHTYDESGEEVVPILPTEELEFEEGGETYVPPVVEHGEEFVIIYQECYEYNENEGGEVTVVNEEFVGYYTEEIPPEKYVEIDQDGEMIVLTITEDDYSDEIPPGKPVIETASGEGITKLKDTCGETKSTLEGGYEFVFEEDTFTTDTYDTSCQVTEDLEGGFDVTTDSSDEVEVTYPTSEEYTENLEGDIIYEFEGDQGKEETITNYGESHVNLEGDVVFEFEEEQKIGETYTMYGESHVNLEGDIIFEFEEEQEIGETITTYGQSSLDLEGRTEFEFSEDKETGETYTTYGEWSIPIPPLEPEITETEGSGERDEECIILQDTYYGGYTIIYGQPTTYITYNHYDIHNHHSVSYTYVLTNIYSGIFKTSQYEFVIYGAGAVNFYNTYYGIDARIHETPSCSCTCGYQTYTFTYSFGL